MPQSEKSERQNNKVIKAGAGYVIGNYLLKGITLLSAPIFTRLLSTEEYGSLGAYLSYESILYILVGLALHSSIANAKYEFKEKYNQYVSSIIVLVLFNTVLWLFLSNIFYGQINLFVKMPRIVVNILIVHCFGSAMFEFFNAYVGLNYNVKEFFKLTSINAIGNMVLSIVLILTLFEKSRLFGRILGIAIPVAGISVYIVTYFFKRSIPRINIQYWKYAIRFSAPIIPHGISQVILASFDRIMIRNIIGDSDAGLYSFAYTVNSLVYVVSSSLDKVWKPWFYERMNEKDYDTIGKQGIKYAFGIAQINMIILLVSPEVIKVLGAKKYWGTTSCVIPILLGGFFSFLYTLPVLVEYFYGKTNYIAVGSVLAATINIVLNYIFIPRYGYVAAAYTTLFTYFLYFSFHFFIASKIHGGSLFPLNKVIIIALCTVVVGFISLLIESMWVLRWILACCVAILSLVWADKNFGLIAIVKKRIIKK